MKKILMWLILAFCPLPILAFDCDQMVRCLNAYLLADHPNCNLPGYPRCQRVITCDMIGYRPVSLPTFFVRIGNGTVIPRVIRKYKCYKNLATQTWYCDRHPYGMLSMNCTVVLPPDNY